MDLEVEISKNREKSASKNDVFFDCVFLSIFGGFGEGFGMLLGGGLEPLGLSLAVFWPLFLRLCAQEGLRGPKRCPRALLGSILVGFGRVWGGVWEDFGAQNSGFFWFFIPPWRRRRGMSKQWFSTYRVFS